MRSRHYVDAGAHDGWVPARPEPAGIGVMLPAFLAVDVTSSSGGRDRFKVLEGVHAGRTFSASAAHLRPGNPGYRGPAHLHYNIGKQRLNFAGGQVRATTSAQAPIAAGAHSLHIPDAPHDPGTPQTTASCATTGFYLGRGVPAAATNDGYLSTGRATDGGITVELSDWPALYRYLILCRSGDGKTVGEVEVVLR